MDQTRRTRIRRLVYNTLIRIEKMENGVDNPDFWIPVLRRFSDIEPDRAGTSFKLLIPFSVWVNKQCGELDEKEIFDYIFYGKTSPQLDLFSNNQIDPSKFITSSEVLEALGRLIKSNGKIPSGLRYLAEEIFKDTPEVLRKEALL